MRALTRALGPIRELDVELDISRGRGETDGAPGRALEIVRREIASRRQALRDELDEDAPIGDLKRLIKKLERVGERQEARRKGKAKASAELGSAVARRACRPADAPRKAASCRA